MNRHQASLVDRTGWHLHTAEYVPEESVILVNPKAVGGDSAFGLVCVVTHEYLHFWMHREVSLLASMQFDTISYSPVRFVQRSAAKWIDGAIRENNLGLATPRPEPGVR